MQARGREGIGMGERSYIQLYWRVPLDLIKYKRWFFKRYENSQRVISLTQFQIDIINRKLEKPNRNKKGATNAHTTQTHTYQNGLDCINKMWHVKRAMY